VRCTHPWLGDQQQIAALKPAAPPGTAKLNGLDPSA